MYKLVYCVLIFFSTGYSHGQNKTVFSTPVRTIFAFGGDLNKDFLQYIISLTKKSTPNICFLPTASADNPYAINEWYELCLTLQVKPSVQRMFVSAAPGVKSFEEHLLSMDAIVVGGGNTLNMMGIWRAQGIDTVLKKAYKKGIILAGGSAGSLCWFKSGLSDSRPQKISVVECLGFINASHCPHFSSQKNRRPLYLESILKGEILPGYACDDLAAMLFENEQLIKAITLDTSNHVYFVSLKDGKIVEQRLASSIIK